MKMYRAGIIGCGGIGLKHASAYAKMENIELVAGADPSNRREQEYRALGLKHFYNNAQEMLSNENLDIVSVCTNPSQHSAMTILAAESGVKGIICEKPMAKNVKECNAMIDACRINGVKLAIGHQRRYGEQYIKGRDVIASGMLGEPLLLWAMTPGSDVMTWGVHWLDMFNFWLNNPKIITIMGQIDVERQTLTGHKEFVEDALLGHIIYENGFRAIIECGDLAQLELGFPSHATIRAYGSKGRFEANDIGYKLSLGDFFEHRPVPSPFERPDYQMWIDQATELIECIEQNKEHQCNGYAGKKTIEIASAIWESARSHRLIRFPMEFAESPLDTFWRKE